jgi:thioredoxin-related protein
MLVFDSVDCQSCELQWESIRAFQREKFGSQAKLEFVMVFGADRINTKVIEAVRGRNGVSFMFDSRGHLEQQLAVQATPFVALVGPDGYVRGYFPGLVNVDAPGFEVLSHIFAGASAEPGNSNFPNGLLVIAALLILALIGALVRAVVRIR